MNSKQIGKAIQKNAKKAISESGIGSSRSGNKELSHLAIRLSKQTIESLENAQILGERLGKAIVGLSQDFNKQYLDCGIIRTLVATNAVPSVDDLPVVDHSETAAYKKSQASQASPPVQSLTSVQKNESVVQTADESETEGEMPTIQAELGEVNSASGSAHLVEEAEFEQENESTPEVIEEPETLQEADHSTHNESEAVDDTAPEEDSHTEDAISPIEPEAINGLTTVEELSDEDAASVVEDTPVIESEVEEELDEDGDSIIESNAVGEFIPTDLTAEEDLPLTESEAADDSAPTETFEAEEETLAEVI